MPGPAENGFSRPLLDDAAAVDEENAVCDSPRESHLAPIIIPWSASLRITLRTSPASSGSSTEVDSSNKIALGCIASARAMATRCCWPPETRGGCASAFSSSPTCVSSDACAPAPGRAAPFSRRQALRWYVRAPCGVDTVEAPGHHPPTRVPVPSSLHDRADAGAPREQRRLKAEETNQRRGLPDIGQRLRAYHSEQDLAPASG
jgi:hypothetical protein